jgi:hypothetical protein
MVQGGNICWIRSQECIRARFFDSQQLYAYVLKSSGCYPWTTFRVVLASGMYSHRRTHQATYLVLLLVYTQLEIEHPPNVAEPDIDVHIYSHAIFSGQNTDFSRKWLHNMVQNHCV